MAASWETFGAAGELVVDIVNGCGRRGYSTQREQERAPRYRFAPRSASPSMRLTASVLAGSDIWTVWRRMPSTAVRAV